MSESMYPHATKALAQKRSELAPEIEAAFRQFGQAVFRDGALPGKTKQLIISRITIELISPGAADELLGCGSAFDNGVESTCWGINCE